MYQPAGTYSHLHHDSMNMDWQHLQTGMNIYLIKSKPSALRNQQAKQNIIMHKQSTLALAAKSTVVAQLPCSDIALLKPDSV